MSANRYYSSRLSGRRLQRCYQIAPFRIRQYLESELQYVLQHIQPNHSVLELGCGYGRILPKISQKCQSVIGIDISYDSIMLATEICKSRKNVQFTLMDAGQLSLKERSIDVVICIQNGISAFKLDPKLLLEESIRITKRNGICLFSSYSEKFWKPRLKWFGLQSREINRRNRLDKNW